MQTVEFNDLFNSFYLNYPRLYLILFGLLSNKNFPNSWINESQIAKN